jgi:hypothetical protein
MRVDLPHAVFPLRFTWPGFLAALAIIALLSALFSMLPPARLVLALFCWFAGILLGFVLLASAARDALKK